jgi:hypothetical protein
MARHHHRTRLRTHTPATPSSSTPRLHPRPTMRQVRPPNPARPARRPRPRRRHAEAALRRPRAPTLQQGSWSSAQEQAAGPACELTTSCRGLAAIQTVVTQRHHPSRTDLPARQIRKPVQCRRKNSNTARRIAWCRVTQFLGPQPFDSLRAKNEGPKSGFDLRKRGVRCSNFCGRRFQTGTFGRTRSIF